MAACAVLTKCHRLRLVAVLWGGVEAPGLCEPVVKEQRRAVIHSCLCRYWKLDPGKVYSSSPNAWDTAVHDASEEYKHRMVRPASGSGCCPLHGGLGREWSREPQGRRF